MSELTSQQQKDSEKREPTPTCRHCGKPITSGVVVYVGQVPYHYLCVPLRAVVGEEL